KLYVCISTTLCLLISCLVLFFLFPRSVTLTPVSLLSATVFFTNKTVEMEITNVFNITNGNFVPVHIVELKLKGLILDTIVGNTTLKNSTLINSQSQKSVSAVLNSAVTIISISTYRSFFERSHNISLDQYLS
ncbi:hypothetical protein NL108_002884, partial [Boleophthalmus pectinirostris]